jgi:hypothetical protein
MSQTRGRSQIVEGRYQPTHGEASPWEETIIGQVALENYEDD